MASNQPGGAGVASPLDDSTAAMNAMALTRRSPVLREAAMVGTCGGCGRWNCPDCSRRNKWRLYVSTHQETRFIALVDPSTTIADLIGEEAHLTSLAALKCPVLY